MNIQNRTIYCKDNLDILRGIDSETVDMIYLDPPFNSKKQWSAPIGSIAEGATFKDTWTSDDIKDEWVETIHDEHPELYQFLNGMKLWADKSDTAYLVYMAVRIIECHRVLKSTGSIFYHCDDVMQHYVKLMLDIIFGRDMFRNEIVWYYPNKFFASTKKFGASNDAIFYYAKTDNSKFYPVKEIDETYKRKVEKGYWIYAPKNKKPKLYIYNGRESDKTKELENSGKYDVIKSDAEGKMVTSVWTMNFLHGASKERTGYPTQKPLELLHRIIKSSTKEGDIILDPFCGCATTCVAAHQLDRQWVGIDISPRAYELVVKRIQKNATDLFNYEDIKQELNAPKRTEQDKKEELQSSEERKRRAHSIYVREAVYDRDQGKCVNCGSKDRIEYDHIIPFSLGGSDDIRNTQILCKKCNLEKSNKKHS